MASAHTQPITIKVAVFNAKDWVKESMDPQLKELELIKRTVAGVSGSLVATSDGLVVAYDVPGLEPTQMVLLAVTVVTGVLTVVPGRATRLQGVVHLALLASFVFLAVNP